MLVACSSQEAALRRLVVDLVDDAMAGDRSPEAFEAGAEAVIARLYGAEFRRRLVDSYNADKAAALFAAFAQNGTWQVPTLVALRASWDERRAGASAEDVRATERVWQKYVEMIAGMKKAGVKFLAGSDIPLRHGQAVAPLHDELVLLVESGLTPMDALQAATRNAAEFLGRLRTQGTVEVGKLADLVLLEASPLDDIANTRRVAGVVRAGRIVTSRARRRSMSR